MSAEATRALKQAFLEAYDHFADRRIKNIDRGWVFIVDDRDPRDFGADRQLYLWFCQILAEVVDQDTVRVKMGGDVPQGAPVATWFEAHDAERTHFGVQFVVRRGHEAKLAALANAFRSIVAPGKRYPVPSYKYVCPRVAASLDQLQGVLAEHGARELGRSYRPPRQTVAAQTFSAPSKSLASRLTNAMNSSARSASSWTSLWARGLRSPATAPEKSII